MSSLWASAADRQRLADAQSALFLVGGYDGSGNYGDVLQLATAIDTASWLAGSPLVVPVIERETHGYHSELKRRYEEVFGGAAFAFFQDSAGGADDGLVQLPPSDGCPARTLVHVYGGGYLNGWWGARKATHVAAIEELAGRRTLPLVASGLQIEERAIAPGGIAHDLLARASWIGLRDTASLEYVHRHIPAMAKRAELAGDDALPFLEHRQTEAAPVLNLHVNDGSWISDEPGSIQGSIVALVRDLAMTTDAPLELQPIIAYEDPRVSERKTFAQLLEHQGGKLEEAGLKLNEPLDVLEDAICNGLATFRRARLTVSCSYHVTLTSLLAGIPAVLLAQNDYYAQKAAGLRDLFQLGPSRIGVPGNRDDAMAAVEALVDGPPRTALVSHLHTQSQQLSARFKQSRVALSVALSQGLEIAALESNLSAAQRRAEVTERELAAVHATRGWRLLNLLRAIRDMMR